MHDGILEYIFKTDRDIHNFDIESKLTIPFEKNWRSNIYIAIGRYDYIFKQSTVIKWIDALERIKAKLLVSIHHYQLEGILFSTIVH